jgi:hydroxymethylbilane synthase
LRVIVGTRGSALAMAQTATAMEMLQQRHPYLKLSIRQIRTEGDARTGPLVEMGGKGVFVKEIENALERGEVDLAVHSLKDMPAVVPPALRIAAVLERADARDALVSRGDEIFRDLRKGAVVGTGSPRRDIQLRRMRPDLEVKSIRGNIDTRIRKLESGDYDAIVLAVAGLARLGRQDCIAEIFDSDAMVPAVGQGAVALEVRADSPLLPIVAALDHEPTRTAITAERAFLRRLGAGCQFPVGAHARVSDSEIAITGILGRQDGAFERAALTGSAAAADDLGLRLADRLVERKANGTEGANATTH